LRIGITASIGGAPKHPSWFFNLRSHPHAVIQVKDRLINVVAEVASKEKKRELWTQLIAVLPFYEKYQKKTTRDIPMVILHPAEEGTTEKNDL
jgi:deazaflavin-dependent oxidoreductase (nitroreductase family)